MPHFENLKLYELRSFALRDLNIPVAGVREHGDLHHRQTWINAIASATTPIQSQPATKTGAAPTLARGNNWRDGECHATSGQNYPKFGVCYKTELACMTGHPAMHNGELREVADGYDYIGIDERNLPIALADEETEILYSIHTSEQALPVTLGMEYFLHCLRNRLQLHRRREVAA